MQSKENKSNDARSFPEIWGTLTSEQREDLTLRLYNAKCCKTRQTVWAWSIGKRRPQSPIIKDAVAKAVEKTIGRRVFGATLFPTR